MENIPKSILAKISLIITIIAVWAVIQFLIVLISPGVSLFPGTLLSLFILFISLKSIIGTVKMNECHVLLNYFTKKNRSVFEGFYWKLPWEKIQFIEDLEVTIDSDISETFTTTDGSMLVTISLMSKPDSGLDSKNENERSEKMATYVKFKKETKKGMQEARAKEVMREIFKTKTCVEAKALNHNDILKKSDFSHLENEVSIKVIECPVKDVDYNKEVQNARNAVAKAEALGDMKKALEKSGYTPEEAKAIAPLLDKDISLTKQIHDFNVNGLSLSPKIIEAIDLLISKLGGGK